MIELEVDTREEDGWVEEVAYKLGSRYSLSSQFSMWSTGDSELSWLDADAHCKARGGQLASILSERESNEFDLLDISTQRNGRKIPILAWIGARQEHKDSHLQWPDGSNVTTWAKTLKEPLPFEKPPFCVLATRKVWEMRPCNQGKHFFICKKQPIIVKGKTTLKIAYRQTELYELGDMSSFHVWYTYKATSQSKLASWSDRRTTGLKDHSLKLKHPMSRP